MVKNGDTLSGIANRHRIGPSELHSIVNSGSDAKKLTRIKPGDKIQFAFADDNSVQRIGKRIDKKPV